MAQQPFTIGILREITDLYEEGEISYGRMVEMLNDVAMKWHNSTISKTETVKTMAQQRLYTEEQVRESIELSRLVELFGARDIRFRYNNDEIIEQLTHIELPTDEEIEKMLGSNVHDYYKGAKWMRNKILNK